MKIRINFLFLILISSVYSLPHFNFDIVGSDNDCEKGIVSFFIYGTIKGEYNLKELSVDDYNIEAFGLFKCTVSENEDTTNEKRKHKIHCHINSKLPRLGYILHEPTIHGFDFLDENGKTTWPESPDSRVFIIGECGTQILSETKHMLMGKFPAYESPFKKISRGNVDKALSALPKRTSSTVDKFSTQLKTVKAKLGLNNAETAYLIYRWLTENIKYDCYNLVHNKKAIDYTATGTFNTGVGVCGGISLIFEMWGKDLGLDAIFVTGYSKSLTDIGTFSTESLHAWNIIKIDGVQYLVDATCGAGHCDGDKFVKKYKDYYFCTNPEYFIRNHYPKEYYSYQLLNKVISSKEFADMVTLNDAFFGNGFKTISQNNAIFTMKDSYIMEITFEKNKNYNFLGVWKYKNGNKYVDEMNTKVGSSSGEVHLKISPRRKTEYELWLSGGPFNSAKNYPVFAVYRFTNN